MPGIRNKNSLYYYSLDSEEWSLLDSLVGVEPTTYDTSYIWSSRDQLEYQDIEQLLFDKFPEYKKLFSNENVNLRIPKLLSRAEGDNPELFYKFCVDCTKLASFSMIGISEDFRELLLYLLENDPKKVFTFGSNGIFLNKKNEVLISSYIFQIYF